ncbi:hypothetical protein YP94_001002 [Salmonella enterica subsp. enterica]|nr:hypothetical protein [Salmonella enterica subsp. enterica serovar Goverdhan]EDE8827947.1 hypothetical protein [Salmonella enterica subsp. enterica serovar Goverdhan]EDT6612926.1 hypothetical protein [Salmonella enterica subsp. enterica]EDT8791607.1 hypothetical protein [Salmonella enterica subsp. enterica]EDV9388123.1 hypothetical protein [Salmonella enterica subsp. enterica]
MPCIQGNPYGEPESTTLLTLLPVLFWPAFAGFFFGLGFGLLACQLNPGLCSHKTHCVLNAL